MRLHLISVLLVVACATQDTATKVETVAGAPLGSPKAPKRFVVDVSKPMPKGLDETAMDLTADPCDDFYQYACGGWMAKTEIPADRPLYSRGFVAIADRNELALKTILEEAAAGTLPPATPFAKQLGDYYGTCLDEAKLENALPEVKRSVAQMTKVRNPTELAKQVATLQLAGYGPLFGVDAMQDLKDSSRVIAGLDQGGLGLPDRDYYVEENERMRAIRAGYLAFVETMFTLWGEKPEAAKVAAQTVMDLETRLAKASLTRIERRDPQKLYNRLDRAGLKEKARNFPWDTFLDGLGLKGVTAVNVTSVRYFEELSAMVKDTSPAAFETYLTWVVLRGSVRALPKVFQDESFAFNAKYFTGAKEDRPRWKKCVAFTDAALGEALGREFARRFFPEESKQRTLEMVQALEEAFERNLATLPWMDEPTRKAALEKVARMVGNNKIGYPDVWRDYAKLHTDRTSFFSNALAAARFETARQLAKIGQPVDRKEWLMSAPTVNAYYEPQKNEIVFPAGILQPPFFDPAATDAVNFGAMGMVVGHEITHGFDDEGRQFDVDGNLRDWWTPESAQAFVERASCVEKQFDAYTAIDELKVKGKLTLGENVADLGGLKLAYAAARAWYAKKGVAEPPSRFTPDQQFFLGFAQSWCTKLRPEQARLRATTDPHSPPYWRVNGPLGNLDAFQRAFACPDTAPMVRRGADRCEVW
jgi:endothelin-converting enzyme/putative endopeptidase